MKLKRSTEVSNPASRTTALCGSSLKYVEPLYRRVKNRLSNIPSTYEKTSDWLFPLAVWIGFVWVVGTFGPRMPT